MENTTRKVQLTRDLKDDTILYQGIRLPCKNDQGYCDPTTRTQATIVILSNLLSNQFFLSNQCFIESILYEDVNPDQIRTTNHKLRNIHNIENKLTRFQVYPETELACKYNKPIYKTQYSEIRVEYENGFDMNTGHLIVKPMATSRSFTDENCIL